MPALPITTCPDGAGSVNEPTSPSLPQLPPYVPPPLCIGTWELPACSDTYQEQLAAENLSISGATVNVFKLMGVHEQGALIDLVGNGSALNGSAPVFDALAPNWLSPQVGMAVLTAPAWLGYDFGPVRTSYGQAAYAPSQPAALHITSLRITQPTAGRRALQVRVERSTGGFRVDPAKVLYTGAGNGTVTGFTPGVEASPGTFTLVANGPTSFAVFFTSASTVVVGVATVGVRFNSLQGSFTVTAGSVPFVSGDQFSLPVELDWYRVDVVNLPDGPGAALVRLKQSSLARYWRLVPTSFSGATTGQPWEVAKLELFDHQATRLDDVQDQLFMENRDRDYARQSLPLKAAYQPFDAISDLSKFGFQLSDTYTFTTVFALMVQALGRPIVVGDVLELPSELQYDHSLRPVRKFLEVIDTSWAADGYTTSWRPITYRFQAAQLIPGQEHRDLLGTMDTQKYVVDDGTFFDGLQQLQTAPLTATEAVQAEARQAVPEKGESAREVASGTNRFQQPGTYDGVGLYVEDGLPPDGLPYTEGFDLPDVGTAVDGAYFRKSYDPKLGIAARLYRFSAVKNRWLWVETDRRTERSAHRPSQLEIFSQPQVLPLTAKRLT